MALQGTRFSTRDADNDNCLCKCAQMLSGGERREWGDTHAAPMGAHPGCHPATPLPPRRLVVRCLRSLQPERHLLSGPAQHPQAQRHPLAPLPGTQLLPEGHPHADTTRQLLAHRRSGRHRNRCQPGTEGGVQDKGWLQETEPSRPLQGSFSPSYIFFTLVYPIFWEPAHRGEGQWHRGCAGGTRGRR